MVAETLSVEQSRQQLLPPGCSPLGRSFHMQKPDLVFFFFSLVLLGLLLRKADETALLASFIVKDNLVSNVTLYCSFI